ncbi:MAG: phosphoribosylglycinamide formyltransferase [Chitinophagaceae bacterium]|jgi:phosphoribosylglycinamide formyltransferase-1|nr:phosphoribosylglycinamide formyltransferase [Chitinophagaceae bacterium]
MKLNIAVFASGAGSNAKKIMEYFEKSLSIRVALIVSNKPNSGVLKIAGENNIPFLIIEKEKFFRGDAYLPELKNAQIHYIVLAGFLWKIPEKLIAAFPHKIINIHPALLPKYGGKGMYGHFVHEAVIANKEKQSGITIHLADEQYDHGKHLFQAVCAVSDNDTPDSLAEKIHQLEHEHFAREIENYIFEKERILF